MSAFLCSNAHINAMATFAERHNVYINHYQTHWRGKDHAQEIAEALHRANVTSLDARYPEDRNNDAPFTFKLTKALDPLAIIKLCNCYDYQACEVDNYETTLACAITSAIVKHAATQIKGYDGYPWGIDDETPAPAAEPAKPAFVLLSTLASKPTRPALKLTPSQDDEVF